MKKTLLAALLLLFVALAKTSTAFADPWTFAVAGDDRTDPYPSTGQPDPTGINTAIAQKLLDAIKQDQPQFLLFTGDLVCGENDKITNHLSQQFGAWTNLYREAYLRHPIYPVRGNHETYGDPDGTAWLNTFKPGLDAKKVTYLPGEAGFSYSFTPPNHPEVVIIALDQFMSNQVHRVNLPALTNTLQQAQASHAKHIFVFAHEMAFTCTKHADRENMAAYPDDRDQFVNLLQTYGVQYFFAGHDHAYDWMAIKHPHWPADYVLNQIVAGTAGAPFYPDKGYFGDHHGYDLTRLDHRQDQYGYLLVKIDDTAPPTNQVTVTFKPVTP
jgi:3',5'-cyclic AMP phosphodiesterase CpdA